MNLVKINEMKLLIVFHAKKYEKMCLAVVFVLIRLTHVKVWLNMTNKLSCKKLSILNFSVQQFIVFRALFVKMAVTYIVMYTKHTIG